MSNAKLTKALTEFDIPFHTPELSVQEYFLSKFEERLTKKKPEWDTAGMTPATQLVAARKELATVDQELAEKRQQQTERRKELDKQWEELRKKQQKLRETVITCNNFIKESNIKRLRAEHKVEEETALQAQHLKDIEDLKNRVEDLTTVKESMEAQVNDYKIYQNFLESVVNSTAEFKTIHSILSRYETLVDARTELAKRQACDFEALEATHTEMLHLTQEKSQVIMSLNNELAELQTRYDHAKNNSLRWETVVSRIKNTAASKTLELGQVKTCCWNIYQQMCKRKSVAPTLDVTDIEQQLVYIKRTIVDLKRIVRIARRRAAKDGLSTEAVAGTEGGNALPKLVKK